MMLDAWRQDIEKPQLFTQFAAAAPLMEYTLEAVNLHRMLHEKGIAQYGGPWVEECEPGNVVKVTLFNFSRDGHKRTTEPATEGIGDIFQAGRLLCAPAAR